jgi:hypothetical protein
MSWHFLGIDLGRGDNILKVAAAVILPEVILAAGTEILAATEIASGFDFVSAVDAINSTTGLTGTEAAKIVGQAAFTAVATDGNLGDVLQNGLTAATGIQVDNIVTDAFDSALAGDVVRSATVAAIGNKDVGQAVALQLIPAGAGAAVGAITSGTAMGDTLFPTDEFAFGYDPNVDIFQNYVPSSGDVIVSPDALGLTGELTINESALQQTNFNPDDQFVSPEGDIDDALGQKVAWSAQSFAANIRVDDQGNFIDPNGKLLLTKNEADQILAQNLAVCAASATVKQTLTGFAGLGASCLSPQQAIADEIQRRVSSQTGRTVAAGPGFSSQNINTPPGNPNGVKMPDAVGWAAAGEAITRSVANALTIIKQIENGTYRPGPVSNIGIPRPPIPGVPVTNRDGSVVVNNGNGTQTVTYPNGTKTTMPVSVAGAGAGTFGGISTNTLLLAGAGLAALLLLRRK